MSLRNIKKEIRIESLVKKLSEAIEQETRNQTLTIDEFFSVVGRFLAQGCNMVAQGSRSFEDIDENERKVIAFLGQVVSPQFEGRRQQLKQKSPIHIVRQKGERLSDQIKDMLAQQAITPEEGLFLIGELTSAVTLLHTPKVTSPNQLQKIEKNTLNYVKGKLALAIDAIRVQQGFVSKH